MDLYDWLLFLHVMSAFVAVGALTVLWGLVLGTRGPSPSIDGSSAGSIGKWGGIAVGVGMMGALLLGIWLAIDLDGYELWVWRRGGWAGGKAGTEFERGPEGRQSGIRFQALNSVALLVILVLMIWKPGA